MYNILLIYRLYQRELQKACHASSWLGVGVAAFQAMSNLALNGIVLVVVGQGGLLLASNQISPGNLMAFLVATQTIQRLVEVRIKNEDHVCNNVGPWLVCQSCLGK